MKNIGFMLLAAGFLAGAYATSLDVQNVNWTLFAVAAAAAIAGLIISKSQASAIARSEEVLNVNRSELRESLQNIVRDLADITERRRSERSGPARADRSQAAGRSATVCRCARKHGAPLRPTDLCGHHEQFCCRGALH